VNAAKTHLAKYNNAKLMQCWKRKEYKWAKDLQTKTIWSSYFIYL